MKQNSHCTKKNVLGNRHKKFGSVYNRTMIKTQDNGNYFENREKVISSLVLAFTPAIDSDKCKL